MEKKSWRLKLSYLQPFQLNGQATNLPVLFCVGGREDGETYCRRQPLYKSHMAREVLEASKSFNPLEASWSLMISREASTAFFSWRQVL